MIIAIDFDDTICYNLFPQIGSMIPNADTVINYLFDRGHTIIIDSCRTGESERQMIGWLKYNNIKYSWVNKNCPRRIKRFNSDTRKISCDISIDDKSIYCQYDMLMKGKISMQEKFWQTMDEVMQIKEATTPLIICIVGESGSGKSLTADYFTHEYGIQLLPSYTNRPKRDAKEQGHIFLSDRQMEKTLERETLAATKYGDYSYCCLTDDLQNVNLYVITEDGLEALKNEWDDYMDIYSIRIHRDLEQRIKYAGKERVERDEGRYKQPDSYFDYVIHNVTSDKNILFADIDKFMTKFRFKDRTEPYVLLKVEEEIYDDDED